MSVFDPGNGYVEVDGQIVERDALRIAEEIKAYDPNLEVICLDPRRADVNDAPFIICEYVNGVFKRVFETWTLDDRVLDRIKLADCRKFDPELRLDELKKIQYERKEARYRDMMDASKDLVAHAAAMKGSKYTFKDDKTGEKVSLYDDRPSERHGFQYTTGRAPVGKIVSENLGNFKKA